MSKKSVKSEGKRRSWWIWVGIAVIFVYVIVQSFFLAGSSRMSYVIAEKGDLQEVREYTGVITRSEQLIRASQDGVVEYYYPGNKHLSKGTVVCSLQDNLYGDLLQRKMEDVYQQLLNEAASSEYAEEFQKLDQEISGQMSAYLKRKSASQFDALYTMKNSVQATMAQRDNLLAILQNARIKALLKEQGIYTDQMDARSVSVSLPVAGMISYTYDNYEGWAWEQVTEDFTQKYQSSYQSITLNMQEIQSGAPLYRLITGQSWYVTFFTDVEEAKTYKKRSEIDFYIDQEKLSGTVVSSEEQNGRLKVVLEVGEYLEDYSSMRIVRLQFQDEGEQGIKIPKECLTEETFYKVQKKYIYNQGSRSGLMVRRDGKDAFYAVNIVYTDALAEGETEGEQYVYFELQEDLEGAVMIESGSDNVATVSEKESLPCVYTINGGYQVLHVVQVEYESGRYVIVDGIELYDRVMIP